MACALAYWLAGMEPFDAIAHSFSTVAIGGFSTHDASIGFFNSQAIELVAIFFIVLSGINFTLHFYAFRQRVTASVPHRPRMPHIPLVILLITALIAWLILFTHNEHDTVASLRYGLFATVSIVTHHGV